MAKGIVERALASQTWVDTLANARQPLVNAVFSNSGGPGRAAKDTLNGVWLGHPLQPVLTDGRMHKYDLDGRPIVLIREADGLHAFSGTCPHYGGPLWEGTRAAHCLTCPWHGSQFDIRDGRLLHGPVTAGLLCYTVREAAGRILVRLEQA